MGGAPPPVPLSDHSEAGQPPITLRLFSAKLTRPWSRAVVLAAGKVGFRLSIVRSPLWPGPRFPAASVKWETTRKLPLVAVNVGVTEPVYGPVPPDRVTVTGTDCPSLASRVVAPIVAALSSLDTDTLI